MAERNRDEVKFKKQRRRGGGEQEQQEKQKQQEEEKNRGGEKKHYHKKSNHNIGLKNDCLEYSLVCKEVDFWCPAEEEYSNLVLTPSQAPGFFIRNFCGKAASPT